MKDMKRNAILALVAAAALSLPVMAQQTGSSTDQTSTTQSSSTSTQTTSMDQTTQSATGKPLQPPAREGFSGPRQSLCP